MEKKMVKKVRWYLRYQTAIGMATLTDKEGIMYWDSFEKLAAAVAKRIDANPDMRFDIRKETYYAEA